MGGIRAVLAVLKDVTDCPGHIKKTLPAPFRPLFFALTRNNAPTGPLGHFHTAQSLEAGKRLPRESGARAGTRREGCR